jgi:predicted nucleic acid-binding protein
MLLVDTNVLLDVLRRTPTWGEWSAHQLRIQSQIHELAVNPVVYAETSPAFESMAQLDDQLDEMELTYRDLSRDAMFLAGHVHRRYRLAGGTREQMLPDFIIGAHATVLGCGILTRDARRYRSYFPRVPLVTPEY